MTTRNDKQEYRIYVEGVTPFIKIQADAVEVRQGWTKFSLGDDVVAQVPTAKLLA